MMNAVAIQEHDDGFHCLLCRSTLTVGGSGWTCPRCGTVHGKELVDGAYQEAEPLREKCKAGFTRYMYPGDRWRHPFNLGSHFLQKGGGRDLEGAEPGRVNKLYRLQHVDEKVRKSWPLRGVAARRVATFLDGFRQTVGLHPGITGRGLFLFFKVKRETLKDWKRYRERFWNDIVTALACVYVACKERRSIAKNTLDPLFEGARRYSPRYGKGTILARAQRVVKVLGLRLPRPSLKPLFHRLKVKLWHDGEFNSCLDARIGPGERDAYFSGLAGRARNILAALPVRFRTGTKPLYVVMTLIKAADAMLCRARGHRGIITWRHLSRLTGMPDWRLRDNGATRAYNKARRSGLVQ